jgi:tetrahydromethanopterin S-methyltransferase subunit F
MFAVTLSNEKIVNVHATSEVKAIRKVTAELIARNSKLTAVSARRISGVQH